jgi:FG-GAP repeat
MRRVCVRSSGRDSVALDSEGTTALIGGSGAAWVFTTLKSVVWRQYGEKLTANEETGEGHFGYSVALSFEGNTALMGAPFENTRAGAAWVFMPQT